MHAKDGLRTTALLTGLSRLKDMVVCYLWGHKPPTKRGPGKSRVCERCDLPY